MSTVLETIHQRQAGRTRMFGVLADRIVRNAARFMRALVDEIGRIPSYQDEAEQMRQGLRRK